MYKIENLIIKYIISIIAKKLLKWLNFAQNFKSRIND